MIRKINPDDKEIFIQLTKDFYNTDAVLSKIPTENIELTFEKIIDDSPYVDGYLYLHKGNVAGYCLLSFTYSNEAGGLIVSIEELYIVPKYQRRGIGSKFLDFLDTTYHNKVAAMCLDVVKTNQTARQLYYKKGFKDLKYLHMIKKCD
ncbi:MAG: GNAT family N-acetyltransferase [Bacilli bacterium]|nr:GNAT family N-acetyltransferase [Bacilli bacterium]MDD4077093.1 GNAT family N-acetyltransferase [Bacilli bacterium]MDD4388456.1 GNAT family N-acetyltransferase [Bacilli bacterium]